MAFKSDLSVHTGYGEQGERLVAGIVPLSDDNNYVMLISSTRRKAWVLPKGGWELDEATEADAAVREAWEEAGIVVKIKKDLGRVEEKRRPDQMTKEAPKASFRFFEASVEKTETQWPEMGRDRQWKSYKQAVELLQARPELLEVLERCSINKYI